MREPAALSSTKPGKDIRSTPAGTEMRERKIGIIRPKKTAALPCLSNHASVRSRSCRSTSGILSTITRSRRRPSAAPIQ